MSQPPAYSRAFSFTNFQASNPTSSLPGSQVDLELNNAKATLDATLANLALIQRDDGQLKNASVGLDQLKTEVPLGFNVPVVWTTATTFTAGSSTVFNGSGYYRCLITHTSGVFATDLAALKWQLIVNLAAVPLVNASQIAVTASGSLTTDAQTSLQALDAGKAATSHTQASSTISDSTAAGRALLTAADANAQNLLLGTTALGFQSGDIKETACPVLQSGWYYCDGSSKNRVTDVNLFNAITIQQSGTTASGSAVVTALTDTSNMSPGMGVSGTGIPGNTGIQSVDSATQVTLTQNATVSASSPLVIAPYGVGDGASTFQLPNHARVAVGRDNASGSASNIMQVSTTFTILSGNNTGIVASATGLFLGMIASSPKLPVGTVIVAIAGTTIQFSANATGAVSGGAIRFSPLLDAQTIGATGGELGHTSVSAEMPSHTHPAVSVVTDPTHAHTYQAPLPGGQKPSSAGSAPFDSTTTTATSAAATGITVATTNTSTGGSQPHNSQPKTIVMNFIIKR